MSISNPRVTPSLKRIYMVKVRDVPLTLEFNRSSARVTFDFYIKKVDSAWANSAKILKYVKSKFKYIDSLVKHSSESPDCLFVYYAWPGYAVNPVECFSRIYQQAHSEYLGGFRKTAVRLIAKEISRSASGFKKCLSLYGQTGTDRLLQILERALEHKYFKTPKSQRRKITILKSILESKHFMSLRSSTISRLFELAMPDHSRDDSVRCFTLYLGLLDVLASRDGKHHNKIAEILEKAKSDCPGLFANLQIRDKVFEICQSRGASLDRPIDAGLISRLMGDVTSLVTNIRAKSVGQGGTTGWELFRSLCCKGLFEYVKMHVKAKALFVYLCGVLGSSGVFERVELELVEAEILSISEKLLEDGPSVAFIKRKLSAFPERSLKRLIPYKSVGAVVDVPGILAKKSQARAAESQPKTVRKNKKRLGRAPLLQSKRAESSRLKTSATGSVFASQRLGKNAQIGNSKKQQSQFKTKLQKISNKNGFLKPKANRNPKKPAREIFKPKPKIKSKKKTPPDISESANQKSTHPRLTGILVDISTALGMRSTAKPKPGSPPGLDDLQLAEDILRKVLHQDSSSKVKRLESQVQRLTRENQRLKRAYKDPLQPGTSQNGQRDQAASQKFSRTRLKRGTSVVSHNNAKPKLSFKHQDRLKAEPRLAASRILLRNRTSNATVTRRNLAGNCFSEYGAVRKQIDANSAVQVVLKNPFSRSRVGQRTSTVASLSTGSVLADRASSKRADLSESQIIGILNAYFEKRSDDLDESIPDTEPSQTSNASSTLTGRDDAEGSTRVQDEPASVKPTPALQRKSERAYVRLLEATNRFLNSIVCRYVKMEKMSQKE